MVGAAGPLRNGDEVEFIMPPAPPAGVSHKAGTGKPAGDVHAVGAVRVQVTVVLGDEGISLVAESGFGREVNRTITKNTIIKL